MSQQQIPAHQNAQPTLEQIGTLLQAVHNAGANQQEANQQIQLAVNQHFVTYFCKRLICCGEFKPEVEVLMGFFLCV